MMLIEHGFDFQPENSDNLLHSYADDWKYIERYSVIEYVIELLGLLLLKMKEMRMVRGIQFLLGYFFPIAQDRLQILIKAFSVNKLNLADLHTNNKYPLFLHSLATLEPEIKW